MCQACLPGTVCPPCTTQYLGCVDAPQPPPNRCAGLDEQGCNQASGCQGVYGTCPPNGRCACPVGVNCTIEPVLFMSCQPDVGVCAVAIGGGAAEAR